MQVEPLHVSRQSANGVEKDRARLSNTESEPSSSSSVTDQFSMPPTPVASPTTPLSPRRRGDHIIAYRRYVSVPLLLDDICKLYMETLKRPNCLYVFAGVIGFDGPQPACNGFFRAIVPYFSQDQLLCSVILDHDDKEKLGFG
jgi:hypothetical protein